jgi:hypothetical protein
LHRCVPVMCLRIGEGSTVRRGLDTFCGGQHGNSAVRCASWLTCWACDQYGHVRLFDNVLVSLTLVTVKARFDTDKGKVGQVGHQVP